MVIRCVAYAKPASVSARLKTITQYLEPVRRGTYTPRIAHLLRAHARHFRQTGQVCNRGEVLVIAYENGDRARAVGVALCTTRPAWSTRSLEVQYICARTAGGGAGRAVMEFVESYARRSRKRQVVLLSVDTARGFYEKLGYVRSDGDRRMHQRRRRSLRVLAKSTPDFLMPYCKVLR